MADMVKGPVGMVVGLVAWLVIFPMILGAINGWYLQASDAGVLAGERFDRVVVKGTGDLAKPEGAWGGVTALSTELGAATDALVATNAYKILDDGGQCNLNAVTRTAVLGAATTAFTPLGTEVSIPVQALADDIVVSGCKFNKAGDIFGAGGLSGLIEIILQAAGLAPPIALLFALGSFGTSFLKNTGANPILAAVLTAIGFLLLATLLNTFIPYVSGAFNAIDSNRFLMYQEGLGALSSVIGNFFGVVIVASIMSVAWQILQTLKGGNALSANQRM